MGVSSAGRGRAVVGGGLIVGGSWPLAARVDAPPYYYLGLAALVAAMIWGGVLAYRSWEEATEELDPATKDELLEAFRQAKLEGELDEKEFERVRRRIEDDERARVRRGAGDEG